MSEGANPFFDAALTLAKAGYRVFPLTPNTKVAAIKEWPALATSKIQNVTAWWNTRAYADCNVGVATGDGLVVLDCDTKPPSKKWPKGRSGLDSLILLDTMGLEQSMRVATPNDGVHVYLKTTTKWANSVDRLRDFPGIDIRGDGGYVVGPGSVIDGVPYRVLD